MDKKPLNTTNKSLQTPPSNGILRPSQRVSNIFQTFAEGGIPTTTVNDPPTTFSVSSLTDNNLNHGENTIHLFFSLTKKFVF
jgi:hypothetical protein